MSLLFDHLLYPLAAGVARVHCRRLRRQFLAGARHGSTVQERLLRQFCALHAGSAFGRDHRLDRVRSWADFRAAVPLRTYDDLRPWADRVLAGDFAALLGPGEVPLMFAKTSGTTGRAKYIPVTRRFVEHYRCGWNIFGGCVIDDHPASYLRHIIQLSSPEDEETTPCGLPAGAISGLLAATQKWIIRRHYPAPLDSRHIANSADKYYLTMRMAIGSDPAFITTANPSTTLALARTTDLRADRLIRDVRDGTLDPGLDLPAGLRQACAARLRPDSALAARLENLRRTHGHLRPADYWRLDFLCNWTAGTLGLYLRDFPAWYGATPVRDIGLLASEARVTIPLADGTPDGLLDVLNTVFEFIPEDDYGADRPAVLLPHELEVGQRYVVVITTCAGLFRYDLGDLVQCTAKVGPTPVLVFLSRGTHTASVTGEKLTEHQVVQAVHAAAGDRGLGLETFVMAPLWSDPPCYRVSLEPQGGGAGEPLASALADLAGEIERRLADINGEYAAKRRSGRLGPVQLRLLPPGTLARLDSRLLAERRGRPEQFKHRFLYGHPGEDDAILGLEPCAVG